MADGTGSTKKEDLGEFDPGEFKNLDEGPACTPGDMAEGKEAISGFGGLKQGPSYSSASGPTKVPMLDEAGTKNNQNTGG